MVKLNVAPAAMPVTCVVGVKYMPVVSKNSGKLYAFAPLITHSGVSEVVRQRLELRAVQYIVLRAVGKRHAAISLPLCLYITQNAKCYVN